MEMWTFRNVDENRRVNPWKVCKGFVSRMKKWENDFHTIFFSEGSLMPSDVQIKYKTISQKYCSRFKDAQCFKNSNQFQFSQPVSDHSGLFKPASINDRNLLQISLACLTMPQRYQTVSASILQYFLILIRFIVNICWTFIWQRKLNYCHFNN